MKNLQLNLKNSKIQTMQAEQGLGVKGSQKTLKQTPLEIPRDSIFQAQWHVLATKATV